MKIQNISTNYQCQNYRSSKQKTFGWTIRNSWDTLNPQEEIKYLENLTPGLVESLRAKKPINGHLYIFGYEKSNAKMTYSDNNGNVWETLLLPGDNPEVANYIKQIAEA